MPKIISRGVISTSNDNQEEAAELNIYHCLCGQMCLISGATLTRGSLARIPVFSGFHLFLWHILQGVPRDVVPLPPVFATDLPTSSPCLWCSVGSPGPRLRADGRGATEPPLTTDNGGRRPSGSDAEAAHGQCPSRGRIQVQGEADVQAGKDTVHQTVIHAGNPCVSSLRIMFSSGHLRHCR